MMAGAQFTCPTCPFGGGQRRRSRKSSLWWFNPKRILARMSGKAVRKRLLEGPPMTHAQRLDGQRRGNSMGAASAAETSTLRPLNPKWEKKALDAFCCRAARPIRWSTH
jgi:hypothetical protein